MNRFRNSLPFLLAIVVFVAVIWTLPAAWCRRGADQWRQGDLETQQRLARTVAAQIEAGLTTGDFQTQSELFNGEWLFGTHLMAGIGFCQLVRQHPETAAEWTPVIEACIRELLSSQVGEFDRKSWKADALETLQTDQGHAAYLGYLNFLLGLYREIHPQNEFVPLNEAITTALSRRLSQSPNGLVATYPNEWYPVDNTPILASIALHARATGKDHSHLLRRVESLWRVRYVDAETGLLIQAINADGSVRDLPRGSGTTLGIFFLHHAYPKLTADLFSAVQQQLVTSFLSFGAVREYPHGISGPMDIDSGPVIFGFGFSSTGFALAGARIYGDAPLFGRLYSSAILAGAPTYREDRMDFLTAGPLGNAILLAMFTAPRNP